MADRFLPTPLGPRILIYHQVGAGLGRQMEVTVEDFEWQLDWLVRNREVVGLETAVDRWEEPDSDRLVVLTFDDGYEDTFTTAYPLLRERNLPFALYLATQSIESGRSMGPAEGAAPLTWEMIGEMMDSRLVTIGAHTHTHSDLRYATGAAVVREIDDSNALIADRVGEFPRHFAYPWGYWSETADRVVRESYETAVLGGSPKPSSAPTAHRLHRYPIQLSDGMKWFESRLRRGLGAEEWVRRRLRDYGGP